jgi:hypothetical protein
MIGKPYHGEHITTRQVITLFFFATLTISTIRQKLVLRNPQHVGYTLILCSPSYYLSSVIGF